MGVLESMKIIDTLLEHSLPLKKLSYVYNCIISQTAIGLLTSCFLVMSRVLFGYIFEILAALLYPKTFNLLKLEGTRRKICFGIIDCIFMNLT